MENKIIVTESAFNMRSIARQMLAEKWKIAVLGTLLYFLASYIPTLIIDFVLGSNSTIGDFLSLVYNILVGGALLFGFSEMMLAIHRGSETIPSQVFSGFEQFGRAFSIYILTGLFILLWAIPSIILFIIGIISIAGAMLGQSVGGGIFAIICFIAALIALILPIRASFQYSQSFFLAIDNPDMGALEVINKSKVLMDGNKWKLFCLKLSFIGWSILCTIPVFIVTMLFIFSMKYATMYSLSSDSIMNNAMLMENMNMSRGYTLMLYIGIFASSFGFLWLTPYMTVATAGFYELLIGKLKVTHKMDYSLENERLERPESNSNNTENNIAESITKKN
ncbi:DUF975 family protein [Anaerovorax odorimutans]|uniref:DUF975 family protein n=1 Tax=Anaerovorax odorimutans TaxID=109327 RepID=UPI00146BCB09|nr:DUF975 family protein [Anaerovorax odorimutans]